MIELMRGKYLREISLGLWLSEARSALRFEGPSLNRISKSFGPTARRTVRGKSQILIQVGNKRLVIFFVGMDVREQEMGTGEINVSEKRFADTILGIFQAVQTE